MVGDGSKVITDDLLTDLDPVFLSQLSEQSRFDQLTKRRGLAAEDMEGIRWTAVLGGRPLHERVEKGSHL